MQSHHELPTYDQLAKELSSVLGWRISSAIFTQIEREKPKIIKIAPFCQAAVSKNSVWFSMGSGGNRNIVYRQFGVTPETCTDFHTSETNEDSGQADLNELIDRYREEFCLANLELAIRTCVSRLLILHKQGAVWVEEILQY
jgi:hypothetical protein